MKSERNTQTWKECNTKKQYENSAGQKKSNMKRVQHEMSVIWKKYNMKRVQHETSATWK